MKFNAAALKTVTRAFQPKSYTRIFPSIFATTPLGTGPGNSRFSSVSGNFSILYAARSLSTAIAETIIRDRFEGGGSRILFATELEELSIAGISASSSIQLLDLRGDGCFQLGVSTDIASAKGWDESRNLAQHIHDKTGLDGILYHSRITGENCIAIFDRSVSPTLTAEKVGPLKASPRLATAFCTLKTALIL
jgi:hypothetical protein